MSEQTSMEGGSGNESLEAPSRGSFANVIILTGGLTGSSVLSGLLTTAGYWCGEDTFKKSDYNTYENARLIRLNRQLMRRVSVGEEYTTIFQPEAIRKIEALVGNELEGEYREFIADCEKHSPWVWKDPRLWLTIRYWRPLIDWTRVRVLLLSRDPVQSWISTIQRRQIQTYGYLARYNNDVLSSLREFLTTNHIDFLPVQYEQLVMTPERELERISGYIGRSLTLEHLTGSYTGPLRRKPKTWRDGMEATLIFLKNFNERIG